MMSFFIGSLVFVWSLTGSFYCSAQVTVPNPVINVTVGQSATLNCAYSFPGSQTNNLNIQWSLIEAQSQEPVVVYVFGNGVSYAMGRFKNRVTAYNGTGNASITISNMQPQDTGFYSCEVTKLPDIGQAHLRLVVLAPPSTPHCSIEGHMAIGHAVTLLCSSLVGMPLPTYTWNILIKGVLKPLHMEQENGAVTIGNMTKFEDGYYQCTASNSLGNATCQLDLHTGGASGVIVGGVIGAVILATLIFVIIWFVIAKKKNKKQTASSEMKKVSSSGQSHPEVEEPARQTLVVSEPPEAKEYRDQPENMAANGEVEDPAV
ncbi:V-set and immunoglobulin domain-containing protein 1 [Pseudophryne corroboree]|uniref:V-set and immunoglobulin domain-containing protein 1 n=1 Tax=Pseudophryne corroboree TaxID=495146 RepID=UPI003081CD9C